MEPTTQIETFGASDFFRRSMRSTCQLFVWLLIASPAWTSAADAQEAHWPQFLGPTGNGCLNSPNLPLQWSESENVVWKTPIRGRGWSSPVIWGDQIWMGSAEPDGTRFYGVCVDRNRGEVLFDQTLFEEASPRFCHDMNSYASPTPVVDREHVYLHFGSYGTCCLDRRTFEVLWSRRDLPCDHYRGPGSSPILYQDLLIIHYDGADLQYIVALDRETGETVWKQDREVDYGTDEGDIMKAYSTPTVIIDSQGRTQLISTTSKACLSLDPTDGSEYWRVRYDQFSATARPLYEGQRLFINSGFSRASLLCVDPSGEGDVTDSHVEWTARRNIGSKPTGVIVDDLIYVVSDQGIASCLEIATGEVVWTERLEGEFSSSLFYSGRYIYLFSHQGKTYVINPGRQFTLVAENQLADGFMSSPAAVDDCFYLRTKSHLYRIENVNE